MTYRPFRCIDHSVHFWMRRSAYSWLDPLSDHLVLGCQNRSLRTIGGAQLLQTSADVMPHRGWADHQSFCNFIVIKTL